MASSHQPVMEKLPLRIVLRLVIALALVSSSSQIAGARWAEGSFSVEATKKLSQSESHIAEEDVPRQEDGPRKADAIELKLGEPLSREMEGGGVDSFKISVPARHYFHIVVEQQGVVVTAELFRPEGGSLVKIESVSGAHGPIHVSEIANTSGDYKLEVRAAESWASAGRYEINLQELRPPQPRDEARIAGERMFAAGQDLLSRAREQSGEEAKQSRRSAVEKFKTAAQQWRELGDHHGEAIGLYMMGATYQRALSQSPEAKQFMLQALAMAPHLAANDWRLEASLWNDLGVVYDSLYDEKNARGALEKALSIFEAHHDRRGRASVYNNLGLVHARLGQAREALKAFQIALPIRQAENDQVNELITLNNIGGAYETLGEPRQALAYYDQALRGWREAKNNSRIPIGLNNVARASDAVGLWQDALNYYQQALMLSQKQGSRRNEAIFLYNLGDLYNRLNDPERALHNYRAALSIHQEIKNPRDEANILAHIAQIYFSTGQPEQALENYNRALQIMESKPNVESRRVQAYTLIGIATVYLNRDLPRAVEYAERARKLSQDVGDLQEEAEALEKMGEAYNALGEQAKALESFNGAHVLRRALEDRLGEASTLFHMANLKRDLGQLSEAAKLGEDMLKIVESLRGNVVSQQLRATYFAKTQNYYELVVDVKVRLYQGSHQKDHLAGALAANERRLARGLVDSLLEANADIRHGVSATLLAQRQENEERLKSKGHLRQQLLNEVEVNQKAFDRQHADEQLRRVNELKQKLSNVSRDIGELINEHDDIQTRIKLSTPKFAALTYPTAISLTEIQRQLLDPDTLLLEYALGDKRSYVWVVSPDSLNGFELPAREQIESVARRVTAAVTARNRDEKNESWPQKQSRITKAETEYSEASAALSKMILEPVAALLGQKRLVIVADGALQLVPFAALPLPRSSVVAQKTTSRTNTANANAAAIGPRPLISEHEIISLPSASVIALQRRELANRKTGPYAVAVLADPVFNVQDLRVARATGKGNQPRKNIAATGQGGGGEKEEKLDLAKPPQASAPNSALANALRDVGLSDTNIPRLTHSHQEAMAIARAVPANQSFSALGFKASRETATSPELSKYRIVHFATHGVLDLEHPELSGIVLSLVDEKGQPQDGYLRLHEIYNLNLPAELVVLSACQTGIGKQIKGEGLIALTRGFMYAGAKSVVASLWKVDDAATSALMAEFYKQMFTNKLKPAAALRAAQVNISQQKRWRSPYYWAGFFIQGEWN